MALNYLYLIFYAFISLETAGVGTLLFFPMNTSQIEKHMEVNTKNGKSNQQPAK